MTTTAPPTGYTFDDPSLPPSPVGPDDLDRLKASVLFGDDDVAALAMAGDVLADQVTDVLDTWYGFVGSHPHLVAYFADADGEPVQAYLDAVYQRFGRWILDTCRRPYDERWLAYQHEIAVRHTPEKENRTDEVDAAPVVPLRYLIAFIYPITATMRPFLARKGHSEAEVEAMHAAWCKSVTLQVALWARPYAGATGREARMADEPLDLDRRLADAVERLGDGARALLRRAAAAEGLSPTQAQLLLRITSDTAPPEGTGALAGRLEVSAPTVSDALRTLAGKGLVERGQPPEPRAWAAGPRGREVAQRLRQWREPLLAALLDQATERKADALSSLLQVIAELNAGGHISTARTCLTCRFFRGSPAGDASWCTLLDTALAPATLRVDCPEHVARTPA